MNVGVTGHRLNRVSQDAFDAATPTLEELLRSIAVLTGSILEADRDCFSAAPAELRILSSLAEGSDRHVAAIAARAGYALHALLPFARDDYALDFASAASKNEYRDFLARAERVLELPGERAAPERAYDLAGRTLVSHADIVIALWDGDASRGRGGTADVIAMALARGIPVLHVQPGIRAAPRAIWSRFEPLPLAHDDIGEYGSLACDDALLRTILARVLLPEGGAVERECLADYLRETKRRGRLRVEYPLLLALSGVRRPSLAMLRALPYGEATAREWQTFRDAAERLGARDVAAMNALQDAYAWSDNLANHFAQVFRSGHVANFALAALAVLLALSGLVWPAVKFWLIVSELATITLLVANTHVGRSRQWHRRWLDYRYLAECLRPMRSLRLYGLVVPAARRSGESPEPLRWPDWYAEALWREQGCPDGCADASYAARLNALVVAEELTPQIDYHRATAHRMETLEHRLHRVGNVLFGATIAACVVFVAGYFAAHDWTVTHAPLFTAITAALPALGGAIYGIRVQGDFGGAASRSLEAAAELEQWRDALALIPPPPFTQAAAYAAAAAQTMLSDLAEWQLTYRQRELAIPA